jgi:hypothetical protein
MAPNGRNATFYRLDVPQFVGMLVEWIEETFGALTTKVKTALQPKTPPPQADVEPQPDVPREDDLPPLPRQRQQEPEVVPTERVQTPWQSIYRPDEEQRHRAVGGGARCGGMGRSWLLSIN